MRINDRTIQVIRALLRNQPIVDSIQCQRFGNSRQFDYLVIDWHEYSNDLEWLVSVGWLVRDSIGKDGHCNYKLS
jgi:hypothetical protein